MADAVIFQEQIVDGFSLHDDGYFFAAMEAPFVLTAGESYRVIWDGTEYEYTAFAKGGYIGIGSENGDPFAVVYASASATGAVDVVSFMTVNESTSHTIAIYRVEEEDSGGEVADDGEYLIRGGTLTAIADAIREKAGGGDKLKPTEFPAAIRGITTGGGGSSADVRYVTFMSHDGTVEYGKKAVAVGDDCADPIARGLFDTPTRETDVQYAYTFYGWANAANGAADTNWNKSITEDKTVYANFAAAVRYYTVTYYDGDTVLKTESLAYGTVPSYAPAKTGYTFTGWEPSATAVTGDAAYHAQWIEKLDFAALTWAQIADYAAQGNPEDLFDLGAAKTFNLKSLGYEVTARIVGFHCDDLADGSGKAGMTLMLEGFYYLADSMHGSGNTAQKTAVWPDYEFRRYLTNSWIKGYFPDDLQAVMKTVLKKTYDPTNAVYVESEDLAFPPAAVEIGASVSTGEGTRYPYYSSNARRVITYGGSAVEWFTRTKLQSGSEKIYSVNTDGSIRTVRSHATTSMVYPFLCVCI